MHGTENGPALNKDVNLASNVATSSLAATFQPYEVPESDFGFKGDECILKLDCVTLKMNFELIFDTFKNFGNIKEIRLGLANSFKHWLAYVCFYSHSDALKAYVECKDSDSCTLVHKIRGNLDVYYPPTDDDTRPEVSPRPLLPPNWLIITTKTERANLYSFRKFLKLKVGDFVNNKLTRFGRSSFLFHAKSPVQAAMLLNLYVANDSIVKEVKPHFNFSYAKGVIFNRDLSS